MTMWQPAAVGPKYAKVAFFGLQGSGKTYTASRLAVGLAQRTQQPAVYMVDTEGGSDYLIESLFRPAGLTLLTVKDRNFYSVVKALGEIPAASVVIIDSATHLWVSLLEQYMKEKQRTRLQLEDWTILKEQWNNKLTNWVLTSPVHVILCGRLQYEYTYERNEEGKRELYKTGERLRAESQFGYEPALLIEMEQVQCADAVLAFRSATSKDERQAAMERMHKTKVIEHLAYVLKDRFGVLQGQILRNPTWADFAPYMDRLALSHPVGATAVRTEIETTGVFGMNGANETFAKQQERRTIAIEELQGLLVKYFPGQSVPEKQAKANVQEQLFRTRSWTKIQADVPLERLEAVLQMTNGTPSEAERVCQAELARMHQQQEVAA